jgi:peptide-methionine (S)-S-oxide reductase
MDKPTGPGQSQGRRLEMATLGGGCFWCIEAVFQQLQGVEQVVSGYAGGDMEDPDYEAVCEGETGHAEVVQVTFDPEVLPYRQVLEVFFTVHDPTTLDRQGGDVGSQYRSIILTHSPQQETEARAILAELEAERVFDSPMVTQVEPAGTFYPAEDYHQDYYRSNPSQGYCQAVIRPKLAKFRKAWAQKLKA